MENVGINKGHSEYSTPIWHILLYFGTFYGSLVYFNGHWVNIMIVLVHFSRFGKKNLAILPRQGVDFLTIPSQNKDIQYLDGTEKK
jgi:hypothetical protein